MSEQGMERPMVGNLYSEPQAKMPKDIHSGPIEILFNTLNEALSSLEKSVVSIDTALAPIKSPSKAESTAVDPVRNYPGGDSTIACAIREAIMRISSAERDLNITRAAIEL